MPQWRRLASPPVDGAPPPQGVVAGSAIPSVAEQLEADDATFRELLADRERAYWRVWADTLEELGVSDAELAALHRVRDEHRARTVPLRPTTLQRFPTNLEQIAAAESERGDREREILGPERFQRLEAVLTQAERELRQRMQDRLNGVPRRVR